MMDKRPVYFQAGDRHRRQMRQRSAPGAEIVQLDMDPARTQLFERDEHTGLDRSREQVGFNPQSVISVEICHQYERGEKRRPAVARSPARQVLDGPSPLLSFRFRFHPESLDAI